jgi:hypothetical protein
MTVFSLRGSKILTDQDGQITNIQDTVLEAVTRIGTNTVDIAYLGDSQNPLAISLSDYNLLFDKVHINDADLPAHVEFFDLSASAENSVRVLNFVYETDQGIEERMFSVGDEALPEFRTPSEASLFFAQHEPVKITTQDDWTIHFDQIEGVETNGVYLPFNQFNIDTNPDDDGFDFITLEKSSDVDVWDVEFANAAHLQDAVSAALSPAEDAAASWVDASEDPNLNTTIVDHTDG